MDDGIEHLLRLFPEFGVKAACGIVVTLVEHREVGPDLITIHFYRIDSANSFGRHAFENSADLHRRVTRSITARNPLEEFFDHEREMG